MTEHKTGDKVQGRWAGDWADAVVLTHWDGSWWLLRESGCWGNAQTVCSFSDTNIRPRPKPVEEQVRELAEELSGAVLLHWRDGKDGNVKRVLDAMMKAREL